MNAATPLTPVVGSAIAAHADDIDTDQIMPARFLKAITFDGLEAHVFADERRAHAGEGRLHPFDDPRRRRAVVLLVGANFGCGSSREHAPQAIQRWGIRAVVGVSFAEIFSANAQAIGLPCLTASREDIARLSDLADAQPALEVTVDLERSVVTAGGVAVTATLPAGARAAFLSGTWDTTGLLLDRYDDVERTAAGLPYVRGF